ncbi:uncharacterized protein PAC_03732 [Phialocephala subalpina]|uniref:Uncharacterized protein n=1 Tax=Phialocephala subalpina TaxID=576137 RepID=A0A1L7WM68_9HELO|nr:uncharacterized protein PAC_03732 [Phialocephala subalpina]
MEMELIHHQNLERWVSFLPPLSSLVSQYRLKQLPNLISKTHTNLLFTITAPNHAFKDTYFFRIAMDSESFLSAALQQLNLSDAGVEEPTINDPTATYLNLDVVLPPHLFQQLNSIKRENFKHAKLSVVTMDPLDWNTGRRANRPFEYINTEWLSILHSLSPQSFPIPAPKSSLAPPVHSSVPAQQPTAYYLEQLSFYNQAPGIDPFASEPDATIRPGPLKIFVFWIVSLLFWVFATLRSAGRRAITSLLALLRCLFSVFVPALGSVAGVVASVEWRWDVLVAVALAAYILRCIPNVDVGVASGMGVEMVEGQKDPVYTVFVSGWEAIGSGPVGESF